MKKLNKIIACFLCCVIVGSLLVGIVDKLLVYANTLEYITSYTNLTFSDLERLTQRKVVSNESPQITVFTHGCGGDASHWSNDSNYKFAKEDASMIEALRKKVDPSGKNENTAVLFARANIGITNEKSIGSEPNYVLQQSDLQGIYQSSYSGKIGNALMLYNISDDSYEYCKDHSFINIPDSCIKKHPINFVNSNYQENFASLIDSKHIIIIFEANGSSSNSNDYIYAQLEFILDSISYLYFQVNKALPTYNLIGHSRGGLTNMQYALAHPYNVASLYSMGTPYVGSDFGSFEIKGEHVFITKVAKMDEDSYGVQDILEPNLYNNYKKLWNDNYETKYAHIDFKPIGTYVTIGFVLQLAIEFLVGELNLGWFWEMSLRIVVTVVEAIVTAVTNSLPTTKTFNRISQNIGKIKNLINKVANDKDCAAWFRILNNITTYPLYDVYPHLGYSVPTHFLIEDDLFIDLDSQVAKGYEGAEPNVKLMDTKAQINGKKSCSSYGVAHNLETHDEDIKRFVVNNLKCGYYEENLIETSDGTVVKDTGNDTCDLLEMPVESETVVIPGSVNGKSVTAIRQVFFGMEAQLVPFSLGERSEVLEIKHLVIPSSVERIDSYAFKNLTKLESVTIQSESVSIGDEAFAGCESLETVTVNGEVTSIGYGAFANCDNLTSVTIRNNVTEIGDYAFFNAGNLNSVTFEEDSQLTLIGNGAFANCDSLCEINIPASVEEIGDYAFFNAKDLHTVTFGDEENTSNLKTIGSKAFGSCSSLYYLTLPEELEKIEDYAFYNCESLYDIEIPASVKTIGNGAFKDSALSFVEFAQPSQLEIIGDYAFDTTVGVSFIDLPSSLLSIGSYAFINCNATEYVTIPSNIQYIGEGAFYGCQNIIEFGPAQETEYYYIDNGVLFTFFEEETEDDYIMHNYLHTYPIESTETSYIVPDNITDIGAYAFAGNVYLEELILPEGLTTIGKGAFKGCTGLTSITIPASVVSIGEGAFEGCTSLTNIIVESENISYVSENGVLFGVTQDENQSLIKTSLHTYLMNNTQTSYIIPETVVRIADCAFAYNSYLEEVILPTNLQTIGEKAFMSCAEIVSMDIGANVTEIENSIFENCCSLTSINVDEENSNYASENGVLYVLTEDELGNLFKSALYIYPLGKEQTTYILPNSITELNLKTFSDCENLEYICIPNAEIINIIGNYDDIAENEVEFLVRNSLLYDYMEEYEEQCFYFDSIYTQINYYYNGCIVQTGYAYYGEIFNTSYKPEVPQGYTFAGWYDSPEYVNTFVGEVYNGIQGEVDLYAKIMPEYIFKFIVGEESVYADITDIYEGLTVTLPRAGETVGGWQNGNSVYNYRESIVFDVNNFVVVGNEVTFTTNYCLHPSLRYYDLEEVHYIRCVDCEYSLVEPHNVTYENNGESGHTATCINCGFTEALSHALSCNSIDSDTHNIICQDCDYNQIVLHLFSCISNGESGHTATCQGCGYTEERDHNCTYTYIDNNYHKEVCQSCSYYNNNKAHVYVSTNMNYCIACEHYVQNPGPGYVIHQGTANYVTANGSYIMEYGCIVLVPSDVESYFNGTLVFYNANQVPEVA